VRYAPCAPCLGTGSDFLGGSGSRRTVCPTCYGACWVNLDFFCRCGRSGSYWSDKAQKWYCGRPLCRQDVERQAAPKQPLAAYEVSDFCEC
jgi:hypothetical protein